MKTATPERLPAATDFNDPTELFWVVDDNDEETGKATRAECHAKRLRHRAVIIIVTKAGQILVMKRSLQKDLNPGWWEIGVGGHVSYGESYEDAAKRELKEETGLYGRPAFLEKISLEDAVEREVDALFHCEATREPKINPQEDSEYLFATARELEELMRREKFTPFSVKALRAFEKAAKRRKIRLT